ncbi:type II toxin-antitoxin system RelE/ParE family toxin [Sphingobium sp.]|uniref:type II toxin-antitoxin system RelE/ParE family toxin n=1 Tax=Sphingobium sp. TaxID=1912891 RepID=UPI0028BE845B|nr:type II toxin-antitoxin system RelE/ParE family toxin [Sphingobium sp.]
MRRLVYLTSARNDLAGILRHIAVESGDLAVAQTFVEKLMARCEHLADLPGTLGTYRPELRPDIRSLTHQGYVIFFRYGEDSLEIVNVLNGRLDIERHFEGH